MNRQNYNCKFTSTRDAIKEPEPAGRKYGHAGCGNTQRNEIVNLAAVVSNNLDWVQLVLFVDEMNEQQARTTNSITEEIITYNLSKMWL